MPPEDNHFCNQHFEFVKHLGVTERALQDIDNKINKLFELVEKGRENDRTQDTAINSLSSFVKAYGFAIVQMLTLLSIAVKLWRG